MLPKASHPSAARPQIKQRETCTCVPLATRVRDVPDDSCTSPWGKIRTSNGGCALCYSSLGIAFACCCQERDGIVTCGNVDESSCSTFASTRCFQMVCAAGFYPAFETVVVFSIHRRSIVGIQTLHSSPIDQTHTLTSLTSPQPASHHSC